MNPTAAPSLPAEGHEIVAVTCPSVTRCAVTLAGIIAALRSLGFTHTLRMVRWMTRHARPADGVPFDTAEAVARRVATVAAFYPGRARCLEQSMTLYYCLRRLGAPVVLRLGVQPINFAAHAWVEYDGTPILEGEIVHTVLAFPTVPV